MKLNAELLADYLIPLQRPGMAIDNNLNARIARASGTVVRTAIVAAGALAGINMYIESFVKPAWNSPVPSIEAGKIAAAEYEASRSKLVGTNAQTLIKDYRLKLAGKANPDIQSLNSQLHEPVFVGGK